MASTLQRLWDSDLAHTRLMLILCGSYVGMMEEAVLGYQAPLYGRRTGQYLLEPLSFHDTRDFFPAYDLVSKELGSRQLLFGLCARGGFTPQVEEEATRRDDLFLFDLPRIAG